MILKIIFFTSFRRSLCVFVQIFCVVRWQRAAAHANGKSQKCCNDGIRNNFHQNDCQRVPIKNNALSQRNVCTQSACGSSSSSRNTHPLSISRSSKQPPWRIRHTNPNIENQIFLEFNFLPPEYYQGIVLALI